MKTAKSNTPWREFSLDNDPKKRVWNPSDADKKFCRNRRKIDMLDDIAQLGEQIAEVWDD